MTLESGMLFEVLPESCLRNEHIELLLGMPLNHVIAALQNAASVIKNIELVYDNKLIEVFNFKNISLHYGETTFSTPTEEADVLRVENCFGATHPGVYDEDQCIYLLHWRGVSFAFPAREPLSTLQQRYAHGLGSLNFSNSSLPRLERMTIFSGDSPTEMKIPEMPVSCLCGDIYLNHVESIINGRGRIAGLQVSLHSEGIGTKSAHTVNELESVERIVRFGDSEESVLTALGAPSKIYYKSDEKMLIQRGSEKELRNIDKPDFFFNYFALGLDILFDSESRRVLKFVLHANTPGHFDFGIYARCNFTIVVERDVPSLGGDTSLSNAFGRQQIEFSTMSKLESFSALFPTPDSGYGSAYTGGETDLASSDTSSLSSMSGDGLDSVARRSSTHRVGSRRPASATMNGIRNNNNNKSSIILNKCTSAVGALEGSENPFGSTFCYGTDQIIVEVMDNSHIASVILYE